MNQEVTANRNISFLTAGFSGIPHTRYYCMFLYLAYFISFLGNSCLLFIIIVDRNGLKYTAVLHLSITDIFERVTGIAQQLDAFGLCVYVLFSLVAMCLPLRYNMIVTHRSTLVIIWTVFMNRVIIIHFCDPNIVSALVVSGFCVVFSYTCRAVTLLGIKTPQDRQRVTKTAHLRLVAVFYVPNCLTYVFRFIIGTDILITTLSLTSLLFPMLNPTHS